ncbi:hypothetical protein E2562_002488 [Oryza meyeriana var. granulata]|uniref:Uncharacterized protein n=1 Tax=Oryza meyeriana var. granulata TaxID=110450 RepID=A0A6G1F2R2_9ORYZ|nr:hypothetical protein E2562_002488 [Oryza meyeriana var. granulata]
MFYRAHTNGSCRTADYTDRRASHIASCSSRQPQGTAALTEPDRLGVSVAGPTLLKAVLTTTFDGLAGKFRLVDGQPPPAYEIVNVVGKGTKTVWFWTPESNISQDLDGIRGNGLKQIVWPGKPSHSRAPNGWAVAPNGRQLQIAVPVKHGFNQFVDVSGDSKRITGLHGELPKADAVVGNVTITSSRMEEVDFTMPFTESGWSMVVAVQAGMSTSMFFFLQPMSASLWLASLASFFFTGLVVWVIEHRVNPEFRGTPWQQFGLIFYFAFSTLVFAHSTHPAPAIIFTTYQ